MKHPCGIKKETDEFLKDGFIRSESKDEKSGKSFQ